MALGPRTSCKIFGIFTQHLLTFFLIKEKNKTESNKEYGASPSLKMHHLHMLYAKEQYNSLTKTIFSLNF